MIDVAKLRRRMGELKLTEKQVASKAGISGCRLKLQGTIPLTLAEDEFTSGFRVISAMLAVSSGVKMVAVRGLLALRTETSPTRSLSSLSILSPAVQIVTTPVARASHFCLPLTVAREFRLCLHPHGMLRVQSLHLPHKGLGSAWSALCNLW